MQTLDKLFEVIYNESKFLRDFSLFDIKIANLMGGDSMFLFVIALSNFLVSGLNVYNAVAGNYSAASAGMATFNFGVGILFSFIYATRR